MYLSNRGTMVMPAELAHHVRRRHDVKTVKLPIEMWNLGDRFVYRVPGTKTVRASSIDPRHALPDIDRANNRVADDGRWTGGPVDRRDRYS